MKNANKPSGETWKMTMGIGQAQLRRLASCRIAVLACLTLAGCAGWFPTERGYRQHVDAWIGSKGEGLMQQWGLPTHEHAGPDGTKVYQYMAERTQTFSGGTKSEKIWIDDKYVWVDIPQPDETRTTWCETTFYLSADDVITFISFQGPDCTAYEKKAD